MRHYSKAIYQEAELSRFLEEPEVGGTLRDATAVLAQVFASSHDRDLISRLVAALKQRIPGVVVVGATTAGEIADGRSYADATVVSLSCFAGTTLHPVLLPVRPGEEFDAGAQLGKGLKHAAADIKGAILFATTLSMDCSALLKGLEASGLGVPILGGAASDYASMAHSLVFDGGGFLEQGCVAVALAGASLHLRYYDYLGWRAIGKTMTVTGVDGFTLKTLDDEPALSVYQRYLGIEGNADFFLNVLEFPLLFERNGSLLARVPTACDAEGGIRFIGDIRLGEKVRMGYGDVDMIIAEARATREDLAAFHPEAIYLYSCACRRFLMRDEVDLELAPFRTIAPTAGFFTYGEFCTLKDELPLLNSTLVIVGLREGKTVEQPVSPHKEPGAASGDPFTARHTRILGRLMTFIGAVTAELEGANRALRELAERDDLTGLYNRRGFMDQLGPEIRRSERFGKELSIILIDIDHFKRVNDLNGHAAGDAVLRTVGRLIQVHSRAFDVAGRIGGEEFCILLPETTLNEALTLAERLRNTIAETVFDHEGGVMQQVTASFGVASYPAHANETALLSAADKALYRAKEAGRNRVIAAAG